MQLSFISGSCQGSYNPFFGRLNFEGVQELPSSKPGIRYHNFITAFILRSFFGDEKIVDIKDIDGKIYHLNRGSLSNWLLRENHPELKNTTKKAMLNVTENKMRIWLWQILDNKSPNYAIQISRIKNNLTHTSRNLIEIDTLKRQLGQAQLERVQARRVAK